MGRPRGPFGTAFVVLAGVAVLGAPSEDLPGAALGAALGALTVLLLPGAGAGPLLLARGGDGSGLSNQTFNVSASVAGGPALPGPPPSPSSRRLSPGLRAALLSLRVLLMEGLPLLELGVAIELEPEFEPDEMLDPALEPELDEVPLENAP